MTKMNVYGSFTQALFFSGAVSIPRYFLTHYKKIGLLDQEMMVLLQILGEAETNPYPTAAMLAEKMTQSAAEIEQILTRLTERKILTIERRWNSDEQKWQQFYSIAKIILELADLWAMEYSRQLAQAEEYKPFRSSMENLIRVFEQELGRPLTKFEYEFLEKWLTNYSEELIVEALRRGVSLGVRTFRYFDSILREWEKKGLRTKEETEADDAKFQTRNDKKAAKAKNNERPKPVSSKYKDLYL